MTLTAENHEPAPAHDALARERARQEELLKKAVAVRDAPS